MLHPVDQAIEDARRVKPSPSPAMAYPWRFKMPVVVVYRWVTGPDSLVVVPCVFRGNYRIGLFVVSYYLPHRKSL